MQKILTIFQRDETQRGHPVTPICKPECAWALAGEGVATVKWDGTNIKIEGGRLFKRQKPKTGEYDEASYIPCTPENPADRWAFAALTSAIGPLADGIYELVGPKVQGNPHHLPAHTLIPVVGAESDAVKGGDLFDHEPQTFDSLKLMLSSPHFSWEGIVFHHPDGRMAKIKRRDFGIPWPLVP